MDKVKVILDVDTGSDDAVAIIAALLSPELEIMGIATVNGNRCVEYTTENTLRIVELLKSSVPVYKGCQFPVCSTLLGRRPDIPKREDTLQNEVHSKFLDMCPPAESKEEDLNAVSWYVKTLMSMEDHSVTLISLGPMTNIANAIAIEPRIVPKIKEIICMAGGFKINNRTAAAEYNVWIDPESYEIVLNANIAKITIVPLDATHDAYLTAEDAAEFRTMNTPVSNVVAELVERRIKGYADLQSIGVENAAPIHDPLCVLALLEPAILTEVIPAHCAVDIGDGAAYGQTVFNIKNGRVEVQEPNCYVALSADSEKFRHMMHRILERS
mgnify:CR=1 FL=1